MIPFGQAKMSILHGSWCKNETFEFIAIECVCESIWVDCEAILNVILGFKWTSSATLKDDVIKYANEDRPR